MAVLRVGKSELYLNVSVFFWLGTTCMIIANTANNQSYNLANLNPNVDSAAPCYSMCALKVISWSIHDSSCPNIHSGFKSIDNIAAHFSIVQSADICTHEVLYKWGVIPWLYSLQYFTGLWYEQKRFWAIFETGSKCVNAEYTLLDDNTVQVNNSGVNGR